MDVNIYKQAARKKLRFKTPSGELTVEQIYELPLTHASGVSLDGLARVVSRELRELGEESFVEVKPDPRKRVLSLQLEIVKDVIAQKIADRDAADRRASKAARRKQLTEVLAEKDGEALKAKSAAAIQRELKALDEEDEEIDA